MSIDPVIATILRFALGWLFLAAAAHKLKDMIDFRTVLATYRVLPQSIVAVVAWCIVLVEICVGLGALWQYAAAFVGAAALLLGYAGVMAINLARGRRFIDCGCGGATQPLSVGLLLRNVAARGGSVAHARCHRHRGRSGGSISSAWRPACSCSRRSMPPPINCSRRARASKSGCNGRADRFQRCVVGAGDRPCLRCLCADPADRCACMNACRLRGR